MITSVTAVAQQVPAYCTSGHGILTPAQWKTCWNAGWSQPTTTAANAGAFVGHTIAPFLIIALIVFAVIALSRRRSGTPATSKG
jgi:large-conductance mechanosensitive channel